MTASVSFNPFDPDDVHEMWDLTARLRSEEPVSRPFPGTVYVARYADCREVLRDRDRFSSAQGFRAEGVVVPPDERMIGEMDAPQHPRIRRLVVGALRPTLIAREEAFTRAYVDGRIDAITRLGAGDLIQLLTIPVSNAVVVHLVGAPLEDADQIAKWGNDLMHSDYPLYNRSDLGDGIGGGFPEFANYIDALIQARREEPVEDLISSLVEAQGEDTELSDVMIRTIIANILLGGVSTTTNLLGNLLYRLLDDQALWSALASDRSLVAAAVEESLRHTAPIPVVLRTCVADTTIGGAPVFAGERIVLGVASANRDDAVYPDAERFVLGRELHENLGFGGGAHLCLGAHLARMQAKVVLEALLERIEPRSLTLAPGYEFSTGPIYMEYGPATLDVELSVSQPA
jgi:cytochrome P450